MKRLLDLPVAVLMDTFELFCQHCHPMSRAYLFSHDNLREYQWKYACDLGPSEPSSRVALASLCRTNKFLNSIATPILYHWAHFPEGHSDDGRSFAFYRTMFLERPDLCQHVRSIHLEEKELGDLPSELADAIRHELGIVPANPPKASSGGSLKDPSEDSSGGSLKDPSKDSSGGSSKDSSEDSSGGSSKDPSEDSSHVRLNSDPAPFRLGQRMTLPTLLAADCIGLQEICLEIDCMDDIMDCYPMRALPRLKTLIVTMSESEDQLGTPRLQAIFRVAPGLKVLIISDLSYFFPSNQWANLRELILYESCLDIDAIQLLLLACPILESFAYEIDVRHESPITSPHTYPRDLIRTVSRYTRRTFRSLNLNLSYFWSTWSFDDPAEAMGSLRSLESLEHLELGLQSFLGGSRIESDEDVPRRLLSWTFPFRIRSVTIEVACAVQAKILGLALDYFKRVCREECPELETIVVRGIYSDFEIPGVSHLISSFEEIGVSLKLRHEPILVQ
ncbi:uncharacterized protein PgNI_00570 [Pyricularia grisea]|uniref:F-box domain-containing protein n=1 Tax=Pyricularia grisea TaxID=148305 RepID=A0A6P8BG01_PYRGI|nr:uncharacterized protein PgNI_00570 [Pyricularia grisea]TLD15549.1 hypothetical protein PgNI_00570 [Pyricularia grisea]